MIVILLVLAAFLLNYLTLLRMLDSFLEEFFRVDGEFVNFFLSLPWLYGSDCCFMLLNLDDECLN